MTKQDFLAQLRKGLAGLPQDDIEERLTFYSEMIEDRMEEGLSEEEAVSAAGPADEIIRQTIADIPLAKIARERIKPKRNLKVWEIVLLVLGSPVWLSLGIAAAAVIFAIYVSLWAVIVSLWAVFVAFAAGTVGSVPAYAVFAVGGSGVTGLALLGAGMVCAGLSIFLFCGCREATMGILALTKNSVMWIKHCFIRKEEA